MKTAILGFGNPVRSDDGIGCYVIEQLREALQDQQDRFTLLDMGTSAFELLFQLQGHARIILVDAVVHTPEPDGTIFCLPATEVMRAIQDDPLVFLHSLKWDQALSYAKKILGTAFPEDIIAYLIAVSDTRLEIGLSEPVKTSGNKACHLILDSLNVSTEV